MTSKWSNIGQLRGSVKSRYSITVHTTRSYRSRRLHSSSLWLQLIAGLWLNPQWSWWLAVVHLPRNRWWIAASVTFPARDLVLNGPFLVGGIFVTQYWAGEQGDTCCRGWYSSSYINTCREIDTIYFTERRTARNTCTIAFVWYDETPLQQLNMAGAGSRHLSLTVMKQPFNTRRQPTHVESSLSQGVEMALSYS